MLRHYDVIPAAGAWFINADDAFIGYATREEAAEAARIREREDAELLAEWNAAEHAEEEVI